MKIAVIGTGTMGSRIVGLCSKVGYTVEAYDPSKRAREAAAQAGAKICSSPASAAEDKNFVVLSLPKPEHVLSVLSGNDGIFARIRHDTIIVDTSTVDPSTNERASDKATKVSCSYLDAPILGRPEGIGDWVMPIGGEARAFEAATPVLRAIAKRVVYVGPTGSGNKIKLINQLMFATMNAVYCEIFALADLSGIGASTFYDVLKDSGASSVSPLFREVGRRVRNDDYEPDFTIDLLVKDVSLAAEYIASFRGATSVTALTAPLARMARGVGLGPEDNAALYKLFIKFFQGAME